VIRISNCVKGADNTGRTNTHGLLKFQAAFESKEEMILPAEVLDTKPHILATSNLHILVSFARYQYITLRTPIAYRHAVLDCQLLINVGVCVDPVLSPMQVCSQAAVAPLWP
jgi:hypothetical protein